MQFDTLTLRVQDHIATVRLNRPDKANAMNAAMWQDLRRAFDWIDGEPAARVAVLEGEGRHFTAGIDLALMTGIAPQIADPCEGRMREALRRLILDLQDTL
ncbi:MAG: enoyl-CoA hydratase, partial [Caulobacteraceae bacterium]